MTPRRLIHCQGDLDGACFLYSIANAYTVLTGKSPGLRRWGKALRRVPHPADFLDPTCGTTRHYEEDPGLLDRAMQTVLGVVNADGPVIDFTWHPEAAGFNDVAELIDHQSVVLFRYEGDSRYSREMDHWVCGVAAEGDEPLLIHAACSSRWIEEDVSEGEARYYEREHAPGRRSNDVLICDGRAELVNGCVFQLRRAPVRRSMPLALSVLTQPSKKPVAVPKPGSIVTPSES